MTKYDMFHAPKEQSYTGRKCISARSGVGNEEGDFWSAGHILKLDCDGAYLIFTVNLLKISLHLKWVDFLIHKQSLDKAVK